MFSNTAEILPTHNAKVRRTFLGVLKQRGVVLHLGEPVAEVTSGRLISGNGVETEADEILWVTAAGAPYVPLEERPQRGVPPAPLQQGNLMF